jgi:hypothetical protein
MRKAVFYSSDLRAKVDCGFIGHDIPLTPWLIVRRAMTPLRFFDTNKNNIIGAIGGEFSRFR